MTLLTPAIRPRPTATPAVRPKVRPVAPARRRQLRAVILLDGAVRASPFLKAVGRSPLDLPVEQGMTILGLWRQQIDECAAALGLPELQCRIVVGAGCHVPLDVQDGSRTRISVERDPAELRGTGGLLHDLTREYADDEDILVAAAAQIVVHPIAGPVTGAVEQGSDVVVLDSLSGTPSNAFVISAGALRELPRMGFIDLKEQALPLIARRHAVEVVTLREPLALPARTAGAYLKALRAYATGQAAASPFAEQWRSTFALVEPGAAVEEGCRLHDSVVLRDARIGAGAVVAGSVVCGGAQVRPGARVARQLVGRSGVTPVQS